MKAPSTVAARRHSSPAYATCCLLAAQVVIWLAVSFFLTSRADWWPYVFNPAAPSLGGIIGSPFVHLHPFHLGVNLAVLWLFGLPVERGIGSLRFLALFLVSSWSASLMHWAVVHAFQWDVLMSLASAEWDPGSSSSGAALGSSGAVAGILGVYSVRYPHVPVRLPIPTRWALQPLYVLGAWMLWELVQALSKTVAHSPEAISHWAHFAGFVFGMWYARALGLHRRARQDQLIQAADAANEQGDFRGASQAWLALLADDPHNFELRYNIVAARVALADPDGAAALAAETLESEVRGGHREVAVADYRRFCALLPQLRLPHGVRSRIGAWLADLGDPSAAYTALLTAAEEDAATPSAAGDLFRAGEVAADHLRDAVRARQAWRRILMDHPHSPFHDLAQDRIQRLSQPRSPS